MQDESTEERTRQVNEQLQLQDKIVGGLAWRMDSLFAALVKVISEAPAKEGEEKSTVDIALCPLADEIRRNNYKLKDINSRIIYLLSRLEV